MSSRGTIVRSNVYKLIKDTDQDNTHGCTIILPTTSKLPYVDWIVFTNTKKNGPVLLFKKIARELPETGNEQTDFGKLFDFCENRNYTYNIKSR